MNLMRVASIFAGCGGSDLGILGGFEFNGKRYSQLPYEIVFALDNDARAIKTYNRNFKHKGVVADIVDYPIKNIPDIDVLIGGFPCQSFSTVNPTKDPFDDRAKLYKKMAAILREKKPKFFIAENVKGLLVLKNGAIFKNVVAEFAKQGYKIYHSLLNAADYGVPQRRQRVFIVGVREDIAIDFEFPRQLFAQEAETRDKQWVGIGSVIEKLALDDSKYYFSRKAVEGMKNAKNNMKRGLAQDLDKPSLTITSHLAKVSLNSRDPVLLVDAKKEIYRRFTPKEAARIQSFPEAFVFDGSDADAYRQIGNAIAPVMMWHVARALARSEKLTVGQAVRNSGHVLNKKTERNHTNPESEYFSGENMTPAFAF